MTSATEFQAKVDKFVTNVSRADQFINSDGDVQTDVGLVPSFPKLLRQYGDVGALDAAAFGAVGAIAGAPISVPIDGNPNELRVTVANATTTKFKMLLIATNTGPVFLTPSSGTRLPVTNGGGVPYSAGQLPAGNIADIEFSPGGAWVVTGLTEIDGSGSIQRVDSELAAKPWGNVSISSGGVRTVTPINKYIVVTGSSNAHPDYVASAKLPSNVVVGALNEAFAGTGINWIPDNQAKPGAPSAAIFGQLAASVPYGVGGQVPYVLTVFGMNECRTLFYHSEGGVLQELASLKAAIFAMRKRGVEPVINTIFPPDPRASDVALDPFWFASTATFPDGGSTRGMDFPVIKAAPVNPETQMQPPASQALTGPRDWTGSGILRQGYKRIQHWNELIRALGAELNVMVLDFEWLAYRAAIETVPDLGSGLETFYETGKPLHPRSPLYDAAVTPILKQWANYIRSGRRDMLLFRNQEQTLAGISAAVDDLSDIVDNVATNSAYRPTLAAAVADFAVGIFFTSRDMDGVSAYPGVKRQYQIISTAPYWADRGPWSDPADLGLGNVDNTRDVDKPVSADQLAAIASSRNALASDLASPAGATSVAMRNGQSVRRLGEGPAWAHTAYQGCLSYLVDATLAPAYHPQSGTVSVAFTQSADTQGGVNEVSIAHAGVALQNKVGGLGGAWADYRVGIRDPGTVDGLYGREVDIANQGEMVETTPQNINAPGHTNGDRVMAGGEVALYGQTGIGSAAYVIGANDPNYKAMWRMGLVVQEGALDPRINTAIALPYNAKVSWYAGGKPRSAITGQAHYRFGFTGGPDCYTDQTFRLSPTDGYPGAGAQLYRHDLYDRADGTPDRPQASIRVTSVANDSAAIGLFARNLTGTLIGFAVNGQADNSFCPTLDNVLAIGSAGFRVSNIYCGSSSLSTSDARQKILYGEMPAGVIEAAARIQLIHYKFKDAAVSKGEDLARKHAGVTAQNVIEEFIAAGENAMEWGIVGEDPVMVDAPIYDWADVPVYEDVEVPVVTYRPDDNGNLVELKSTRKEQRQIVDYKTVVTADGIPVIDKPAVEASTYMRQELRADDSGVVRAFDVPVRVEAREAIYMRREVPRTERKWVLVRTEKEQARWQDGSPKTIMSVRYEELEILLIEALRRQVATLSFIVQGLTGRGDGRLRPLADVCR